MNKDIQVHWLNTIDSTNSEALRNMAVSDGITVWVADYQTAGRGQRGNSWESENGMNLTFSILFKPDNILAVRQFAVSQITTLGILSYLSSKNIEAKIKWPNDIYVADNKICGILIENIISGDKLSASVVGIGVNMKQTLFRSDAPNPTSLSIELQKKGNSQAVLDNREEFSLLMGHILSFYDMLSTEQGWKTVEKQYHDSLYRLGRYHRFEDIVAGGTIEGKILGVDEKARLKIELRGGQIKCYAFKEIKYIL